VSSLSKDVSILSKDVSSLSKDVSILSKDLSTLIRDLPTIIESAVSAGINREEQFIHNKLEVLKNVTISSLICTQNNKQSMGTLHAVTYKGHIMMVTAAHFDCGGVIPSDFIACKGVDISLSKSCPVTDLALNVSVVAELRDADLAVSFGYPVNNAGSDIIARSWVGRFSGMLHKTSQSSASTTSGSHFAGGASNMVYQVADAFVFSATQLGGASGAGALNDCGYLGVAHMSSDKHSQCYVTPWKYLHECIESNMALLKKTGDCPSVKIIDMPLSPSRSCTRK
jgi:hypothetical protein